MIELSPGDKVEVNGRLGFITNSPLTPNGLLVTYQDGTIGAARTLYLIEDSVTVLHRGGGAKPPSRTTTTNPDHIEWGDRHWGSLPRPSLQQLAIDLADGEGL